MLPKYLRLTRARRRNLVSEACGDPTLNFEPGTLNWRVPEVRWLTPLCFFSIRLLGSVATRLMIRVDCYLSSGPALPAIRTIGPSEPPWAFPDRPRRPAS